ncbi:glycosyltransferase, partial [Fusobacterium ulcerans]
MGKIIVVNNPAAKSGGALTILKEFLENVSSLKCDRIFIIIVSVEDLKRYESEKIKILVVNSQKFKERILWDNFKLKRFLKKKAITPDIFVSLQNTGVNIDKKIYQLLYYHQPLSIIKLKWNILRKNERLYWIYKNIYPIFIKQYLNRVRKVIVQTEWVKKRFVNRFNYPEENIILMRPIISKIDVNKINIIPREKYRIFYPAAPLIYKNHKIIIEALNLLKKEKYEVLKGIECIFTFGEEENAELADLIKKYELEDVIKLVGRISYSRVLEYYKSSDLLVFPSYLETFGLPLVEAQYFDLDILTVDLEYSREVINEYKKVCFIKKNDVHN